MSLLDLIRMRASVMDSTKSCAEGVTCPGTEDAPIAVDQPPTYRHWIVHYPDSVVESVFCPPVSYAELMRLDSKAIAAEPVGDLNTNIGVMSCKGSNVLIDPDMYGCDECNNLSLMGICVAATRLGAMPGYRPVLGRRFDQRCPEWKPP